MKYTLKDSYVYDLLNLKDNMNLIATKIVPNLEEYKISADHQNMILNDFKYKIRANGKEKIINAIDANKIVLVNAPGVLLPAWALGGSGEITIVVNVAGKAKIGRDDNLVYQAKEIYGLVVLGFVLYQFFNNERKVLTNRVVFLDAGVIYVRMMLSILDQLYSIVLSMDPGRVREYAGIGYILAKFYVRRVMQRESNPQQEEDNVMNILNRVDQMRFATTLTTNVMDSINGFPDEGYKNIDTLLKAMAEQFDVLNKLETNHFLRKMIMTLGDKSLLMLESPHYLLGYIASYVYNANLIKDFAFKNVMHNKNDHAATLKVTNELIGM